METSQAQRGQQWLEEVLQYAAIPTSVRLEKSPEFWEDSCWLVIDQEPLSPEQIQALIGTEGAVLDSLQYLANTILNLGRESGQQGAFTVDLAGYRLRRYAELQAIADQAAIKARETGTEIELKGLSAAERRQVHTLLKEQADLETQSRGQEPDRRLVVSLVKQTP
jgi:spoIIIJ-associated protein